ncbi:hypothetical protein COY17_01775 [Candidatus Saccharibacteria bacterium CG_4_10_14_0_2_um_filter_52_9]|nr:MAG: hypothetical protein COY17_01775 [Candidatus Saccharibacteria bacterium CG_4_10_14_0_2_um_filter_52_9]
MSFFRRKKAPNIEKFTERWVSLQKLCSSRKTWPQAIIEADDLLDEALRCNRYKGKSTGERLVAAQHNLSSNDTIWVGHKLSKKVAEDNLDVRTLKKKDMVVALSGFRQALRDLGALKND